MSREFLVNLIFLLLINAIIKPVYIFWIDRGVQNAVGQDYGIYFSLLSFTYLFQMLNDFGLQNFNARKISMNPEQLAVYMPGILQLKIILAALFCLLVFLFAYLVGYEGHYIYLLIWLCVFQILSSFLLYMRSNIAGLGLYRIDSFMSVFDKMLVIIIIGYFLLNHELRASFQIEWFLYAQVFALVLAILLASFVVLRTKVKLSFKWRKSVLINVIKESYPFALIFVLTIVYTRIDAVMVERMLPDGVYEAYIYASAYRLLDAANMISYLFIGLLLPMFSRMLSQGEGIQPLFRTSVKLMTISTACVALPVLFFGTEIMEMLYVDGNEYSGHLLRLLLLGHIFISFGQVFGALMLAGGHLKQLNILYSFGLIVNILLNVWLIPEYKALGAAFSTLMSEILVLIGFAYLIYQKFTLLWTPRLILKVGTFGFLCGFALYTLNQYEWPFDWRLQYFGALATCLLLSVILRILPSKELLEVLQRNQKARSD